MKLWFALSIKYLDLIFILGVVFSQSLTSLGSRPSQPSTGPGSSSTHEGLAKSRFLVPRNLQILQATELWPHLAWEHLGPLSESWFPRIFPPCPPAPRAVPSGNHGATMRHGPARWGGPRAGKWAG